MTNNNIEYTKAYETLDNTYPPAQGFINPGSAESKGTQVLIGQNNIIIELLLSLHTKLDRISGKTEPLSPELVKQLEQITQNLATLPTTRKTTVISSTSQPRVVWRDPKTLFPPK